MHLTLDRALRTWSVILAQLRCGSVCWQGIPLSDRDMLTYTESIVLWALHLTDMSLRYDGLGSHRELVAWAKFLVTLDVYDVGSFLSDAVQILRNISEPASYNWFKRQLRESYPFTGEILAPLREVLSRFLESPNPRDFRVCQQALIFPLHLTLVDLPVDTEQEYLDDELRLSELTYPESVLDGMNAIMREWLEDFSITEESFLPSHGPGAVAELNATASVLDKYQFLGTDPLLEYVFRKHAGVDVTSYMPLKPKPLNRCAKVVSVPKSMKTRRTISKEPAGLMYFQQGVSRCLVDFIHQHSFLSGHIDLKVQEKNGKLALRGSATQQYSTLDLSSASDTVTLTLVKAVFRNTPLYPFLVALRSRTAVLPSGKVIAVEKYAPMGSALCFPIETLIFSCAVEFAVRRAVSTHLGFFPRWRVYGDDIIVQEPLFWDVLLVLESLGFIVNQGKSFTSPSRYRESCGTEGYDGVDVTPMKISRGYYSPKSRITSRQAPLFEGLIDMVNSCHIYEFSLLRAWLLRVLLANQVAVPLFSEDYDRAVYSPCPDNYRAKTRWNSALSRREVLVAMSHSVQVSSCADMGDDTVRYFETLRSSFNREGDMFEPDHRIEVPRGSVRTVLAKKWVAKPVKAYNLPLSHRESDELWRAVLYSSSPPGEHG